MGHWHRFDRTTSGILLDVRQDWLLLVSGLIAVPNIVIRDRHAQGAATDEASLTPSVELRR